MPSQTLTPFVGLVTAAALILLFCLFVILAQFLVFFLTFDPFQRFTTKLTPARNLVLKFNNHVFNLVFIICLHLASEVSLVFGLML